MICKVAVRQCGSDGGSMDGSLAVRNAYSLGKPEWKPSCMCCLMGPSFNQLPLGVCRQDAFAGNRIYMGGKTAQQVVHVSLLMLG